MKKILLIIVVLVFASCDSASIEKGKQRQIKAGVTIVKIDGCEYVVYRSVDKGGITHKGNCSNPIHKVQSKTNEIILN